MNANRVKIQYDLKFCFENSTILLGTRNSLRKEIEICFLVEIPRWLWHSKDPYAYSATAPTGHHVYQFQCSYALHLFGPKMTTKFRVLNVKKCKISMCYSCKYLIHSIYLS